MSQSEFIHKDAIAINGGFLGIVFGSVADLYDMDHGEPLAVGTPLPSQYLRRFDTAALLGELEVLYLGLCHLLTSPGVNLQHFNMAQQDWADEEMRHLLEEIKRGVFPIEQPKLDKLLPLVTIVGGMPVSDWCDRELPKLRMRLPKMET